MNRLSANRVFLMEIDWFLLAKCIVIILKIVFASRTNPITGAEQQVCPPARKNRRVDYYHYYRCGSVVYSSSLHPDDVNQFQHRDYDNRLTRVSIQSWAHYSRQPMNLNNKALVICGYQIVGIISHKLISYYWAMQSIILVDSQDWPHGNNLILLLTCLFSTSPVADDYHATWPF